MCEKQPERFVVLVVTCDSSKKFAIIDLETTGLDPLTDRIIEIAIIQVDESLKEECRWSSLINPQQPVTGTEIHGLDDQDVRFEPYFHDLSGKIFSLLYNRVLVSHNATFDCAFLNAEFNRAQLIRSCQSRCSSRSTNSCRPSDPVQLADSCPTSDPSQVTNNNDAVQYTDQVKSIATSIPTITPDMTVCTMNQSRIYSQSEHHSLVKLVAFHGITGYTNQHRAMPDAQACLELFKIFVTHEAQSLRCNNQAKDRNGNTILPAQWLHATAWAKS
ncbi:DNA polymerase III epsilon subunit-like protein [Arcanobacterium pluranimalium]|uniref:3'-5' exonuclease n=1 Tax=Arcanobacterium pluranimalium TaxID=108028 RepID=UPI00195D8B20|nr:3'-5' exonuclease [Arcanobacterium pluranimalium]MBM7825505.1 DNA polymerase III epsilon subunit-like protein [Arcanobacterium pluranimalium]